MATAALRAQPASMRILMAGYALRIQGWFESGVVALGALELGVAAG